ncbi:MAG TPA: hypothetical protein IAB72_01380 [Candidatus Onthoplasma faecipullorum]|nr:hypothetical protein [Candidatus Onthoplasma faecipullorum]
MKEIEITCKIYDKLKDVKQILTVNNFVLIDKFYQKDLYFSKYSTTKLIRLSANSLITNSMLIRNYNNQKYSLIHKHKFTDKKVISETKISENLSNPNKVIQIFSNIGLNNWATIENFSYVYSKDKLVFILQDIKDLGLFIECEFEASYTKKIFEIRQSIINTLKSLNLNFSKETNCNKAYLMLHKKPL